MDEGKKSNGLRFDPQWLTSPWVILFSAFLGIYLGVKQRDLAAIIAPVGKVYLTLLKMCVLPILLAAITMSIGRLIGTRNAAIYIKRILTVFPLSLLSLATIGLVMGVVFGPGRNLSEKALKNLGVLVNQSGIDLEISLTDPLPSMEGNQGLVDFLLKLFPDNIFQSLSQGETLQVLFFSIVFGIAIGLVKGKSTETLLEVLDSAYKALSKLISWLTYFLPFGLCSLLGSQIAKAGLEIILSMLNFVVVSILMFVLIYGVSTVIIAWKSRSSLVKVLLATKDPSILALATTSSLACLPSAITAMSESLNFSRQSANLIVPLAITVCRFGSVAYFALATPFVAQVYNTDFGLGEYTIVIIVSILAGMATSGATGIVTLTLLELVLKPLGLPSEAVLVLFIAIDPIVDPFRTLGIVHTGMAAASMIAELETPDEIMDFQKA